MAKGGWSGKGFGMSWGFGGVRFGRSQFGNWWISVGLPFGFRMTKRLGGTVFENESFYPEKDINNPDHVLNNFEDSAEAADQDHTENSKILNRIRGMKSRFSSKN